MIRREAASISKALRREIMSFRCSKTTIFTVRCHAQGIDNLNFRYVIFGRLIGFPCVSFQGISNFSG